LYIRNILLADVYDEFYDYHGGGYGPGDYFDYSYDGYGYDDYAMPGAGYRGRGGRGGAYPSVGDTHFNLSVFINLFA
jgi:hypothetical protein